MQSREPRERDRDLPLVPLLMALALAVAAFALQRLVHPSWVETRYARGFFPPLRSLLSSVASLFPVSASELAAASLALLALLLWGRNLRDLVAGRRSAANLVQRAGSVSVLAGGALYFLFVLVWGLNHARASLAASLGLVVAPSQVEELHSLIDELEAEALAARGSLEEDAAGCATLTGSLAELWPRVAAAWDAAGREEPLLAGPPPLLRVALASPLLTAGGITGIYSPFSGESHVNGQPPPITLPFVAAHEVAHARGFAREDQANYLAARVCRNAQDADLRYSGALLSLRYCLNALLAFDAMQALERRNALDPALDRDLAAIRAFWSRERSAVVRLTGHVAGVANDSYLRSQGDERGAESYGAMVDFLLAERRTR